MPVSIVFQGAHARLHISRALTTKVIATSCDAATTINNGDRIFQPTSLVPLPPTNITTYATNTASSNITLKFIRKPVLLHMLQKERLSP